MVPQNRAGRQPLCSSGPADRRAVEPSSRRGPTSSSSSNGSPRITLTHFARASSGYAWSESLGWVSFRGGSGATAYGVGENGPDPVGNVPALSGAGLAAMAVALGAAGLWLVRARLA